MKQKMEANLLTDSLLSSEFTLEYKFNLNKIMLIINHKYDESVLPKSV